MKTGDIVITINNDGRYAKGTECVVLYTVSNRHAKPIRVRTLYGQCEAWYDEALLKLVKCQ